ncbi:type II toxin-antitoxin system VapB family antitoxin [Rhodoferax sp.]|uniref:type II toxin-antitoxin system VapB family antitoxin n=1 Tax=Rhodoferax sp. TaxID=50421 RepID=UPI0026357AA8|nr:type II toxin-antitoxin system VapB family antitoxin [Rhodoferax sp.]MDD2925271.1 type II toxin-antitoxin system VapB family antitoxin [Rhodoferax sp.]
MRTNIEIDDKLMDFVMSTGDFKTKREAVEAGLQMIKRRKAYDALLAARGTLHWDDSDEAWARQRAEVSAEASAAQGDAKAPLIVPELAVHEPATAYKVAKPVKEKAIDTPSSTKRRTKKAAA